MGIVELEKRGIIDAPRSLQTELVALCGPLKDRKDCYNTFCENFIEVKSPIELLEYEVSGTTEVSIEAQLKIDGKRKSANGKGNGPIDAYLQALNAMYQNN